MRARQRRRVPNRQGELFDALSDRPRWPELPEDTRETVTELLARMLRQHRQAAALQEEADDE